MPWQTLAAAQSGLFGAPPLAIVRITLPRFRPDERRNKRIIHLPFLNQIQLEQLARILTPVLSVAMIGLQITATAPHPPPLPDETLLSTRLEGFVKRRSGALAVKVRLDLLDPLQHNW
ncbi:hypothetical protein D9615_002460 [Tricholomella constricta]|uniref:Uncharacterized protein n=1 Tax=Tricholomella constricta TaxID=117010 RepID=A0A8H5M9M1_9AGAR|nr:hypothetical protein D9615_002460 [Tricholomella constricta]